MNCCEVCIRTFVMFHHHSVSLVPTCRQEEFSPSLDCCYVGRQIIQGETKQNITILTFEGMDQAVWYSCNSVFSYWEVKCSKLSHATSQWGRFFLPSISSLVFTSVLEPLASCFWNPVCPTIKTDFHFIYTHYNCTLKKCC